MSRRLAAACLLAAACTAAPPDDPPPAALPGAVEVLSGDWTERQTTFWRFLVEELEVMELAAELTRVHHPEDFVIENVRVVPMTGERVSPGWSVLVRDGIVAAAGPAAEIGRPAGARVVDGTGRWLLPGLADMHMHSFTSHSHHLLNLAMGVTTLREMAGFPYLLAMRDQIADGRLLAPTLYVAGTILNQSDFGGYARALSSPAEARRAVREQAAAGYDFVKTHNSLTSELFAAIVDEADRHGLDVVGHIPVPVSVETAVASGMRTFEHFKGYILDSTLQVSEEDWAAATAGAEVWNTPTFVVYRNQLRGEEAAAWLADESRMRYVSPLERRRWARFAAQEVDRLTELRQSIYPKSRRIFAELRRLEDARFLAGTDAGSYELMVPGFALLEELAIFQELGMTPYEAIATATTNAAAALRAEDAFGTIEPGKRADLVLYGADPLEDVANLHAVEGVAVRGTWIGRAERRAMLDRLRAIYRRSAERMTVEAAVTGVDLDEYLERLHRLDDAGFVFRDHDLELAASMYRHVGRDEDAAAITAMKRVPGFGFARF